MPLVELFGTSDESVAAAIGFYKSVGRHPITMNRQLPGHVANRLTSAIFREAVWMLKEGIASVADIDAAMSQVHNYAHAPQSLAAAGATLRSTVHYRACASGTHTTHTVLCYPYNRVLAAHTTMQGPGMRFAHMGPFQTYHLAAGDGGIAQYLEHLGPSQEARWASLGESPALEAELKQQIVDGVDAMVEGKSIAELGAARDTILMEILGAKSRL